jgi:endoglucanase
MFLFARALWALCAALVIGMLAMATPAAAHHRTTHGATTTTTTTTTTAPPATTTTTTTTAAPTTTTTTAAPTTTTAAPATTTTTATPAPSGGALALPIRVNGNRFVDATGRAVQPVGVNHAGTEYACAQGWGFFDGPNIETVPTSFADALAGWKVDMVRIPLNEHCWLDINSNIPSNRRGEPYRQAVTSLVDLLANRGIVSVLELHRHAPGTRGTENNPMPNRQHSPAFWASVSARYANHPAVVFDLVNEPHPDNNRDSAAAWSCWRNGGWCNGVVDRVTGQPYEAAGMQELVDAIRSSGARNLILVGGVSYANALTGWLANRPHDPAGNLAAKWHVYDESRCNTVSCYDTQIAPVTAQIPVLATEVGPDQVCNCPASTSGFSRATLDWMASRSMGFLPWTWNRWNGYSANLISAWDGTPTSPWGTDLKQRIAAVRTARSG